ncbi:flavin reductase family protein [Salinimonas chungwhensis]|uniref:flavin reductase family protein n=1 Tax=Salinimonas chungwhensis TaxID=265425 RepID=UPI00035FAA9A|nr:flavin reductase [Salinimonas chungwhensis]
MSEKRFLSADIATMEQRYRAAFMNSLSGVKSANLIGTSQGRHVNENLAIISSVVHIGANPPLLGMIMRPHTVVRDTLENIQQTGVYTINHVSSEWTEAAHQTSASYPSNVSEFDATGLTSWYADDFDAPFVQASPVKLAMQLAEIIPIKLNNTQLVIGEISSVWIDTNAITAEGQVNLDQLGVAAITGLDTYHTINPVGRYAYAKP